MHVGLVLEVHGLDGLNHLSRGLRCGGVVEIDKRLAVYFTVENGKFLAEFFN